MQSIAVQTGTTQAQFDSSTKLATTEFVARAVQMSFQRITSKSGSYTVTAADVGTLFFCSAATTYTLPDASAFAWKCVGFFRNGGDITIKTANSNQNILGENLCTNSLTISKVNAGIWITSDGTNWIILSASPAIVAPNVAPARSVASLTVGPGTTYTVTASLTAPRDGYVFGIGHFNVSGNSIFSGGGVSMTLKINGTKVADDSTPTTQSHSGYLAVSKGESCSAQYVLSGPSNLTNQNAISMAVSAFFLPS